jgi:predicted metal-binding membrane protein
VIATFRARTRLPHPALLLVILGGWALAVVAEVSGRGKVLHHDALIHGGLPTWAALGVFLIAWQVMIAAMMLPSSLPLIRLFNRVAAPQSSLGRTRAAFIAGYAVVWTAFGALAFMADLGVHRAVTAMPWMAARPWLIAGGVLVLAGAFQFSGLKDACLKQCRNPGVYLLHHYRRGSLEAFRLGRDHGLFCLGCCWAIMLVSFAAGVANLAWMAVLTLIMVFEKTGRRGDRGVVPIGLGLLALGGLVLLHPVWLPSLFASR